MAEVASAWVTIVPSARGFKRKLASELDGEGLTSVGETQGRSIGDRLVSGFGGVVKKGAVAVAAAGVATVGTALVKGFGRLNALDQATAKLEGLGHSAATVESIMTNATAAVTGTAFGLDEAATAAAGAVAAGVAPGEALQRSLTLVADAATIAGTDMSSMGAIFNKVAASNKVQMDVINQLHDAGVPALQLLAQEMGVTAEEASKMASRGEIDFATFQNAMESGLGGAALKSGNTAAGAFKNLQASLGRIGANVLGGAFGKIAPTLQNITTKLQPVEKHAKAFGEAIGTWMKGDGAKFLKGIADGAKSLFSVFSGGGGSKSLEGFRDTVQSVFSSVKSIITSAVTIIQNLWRLFGDNILSYITTVWSTVQQVFSGAFTFIQGIFNIFAGILSGDWSRLWEGIKQVLSGAWSVITGLVQAAWNTVVFAFQNAWAVIVDVVSGIAGTITGALGSAWSSLKSGAASAWDFVQSKIQGVVDFFRGVPGAISSAASGMWDGIKNAFKSAINWIIRKWNGLKFTVGGGSFMGVDIPSMTLGVPPIEPLAKGGVVTSPLLSLIGEAGHPEAVIPLSGPHAPDWVKNGPSSGLSRADLKWLAERLAVLMDTTTGDAFAQATRAGQSMRPTAGVTW